MMTKFIPYDHKKVVEDAAIRNRRNEAIDYPRSRNKNPNTTKRGCSLRKTTERETKREKDRTQRKGERRKQPKRKPKKDDRKRRHRRCSNNVSEGR